MFVEGGVGFEKLYEEEFGPLRNTATGQGGGFGAGTRSATQPYASVNFNKTVSKKLSVYGFIGSIFNAFDFDFGAGPRYPRASSAFTAYLESPEYQGVYSAASSIPTEPEPSVSQFSVSAGARSGARMAV